MNSNLNLWLKADGDIYNTSTTQAVDGESIETWVDTSTDSRNATQASSAVRPSFYENEMNFNPVVR